MNGSMDGCKFERKLEHATNDGGGLQWRFSTLVSAPACLMRARVGLA